MGIEDLVNDKKIIDIISNYLKLENIEEFFNNIREKKKNKEIIIPVLGLQGMGKSTLINSILSENILPNDADETTCVPVEVKYGENEKALVYFKNTKETIEVFTREDLNEYVSNEYNPANVKNVSHIVLYRNIGILKNGITIVDLPGVGSLTRENQETTMRYIKNLCTAVFVIPTTPTIRRSEELFIKSVWMQFTSAIFVQNNFGENKREVEESIEFNTTVLKNIAKSIKNNFDEDIIVVNAYNALYGKLNNKNDMVEKSNIHTLINKLDSLAVNWNKNEEENIKARTILLINECKNKIAKYKEEALLSDEQLKKRYEEEEEIFKLNTKKIKSKIDEIQEFLDDKEYEVKAFAKEKAKICTENIRSNIFRLIDNGVVDGEMLTEAFNDLQQQFILEVINEYFDFKEDISNEINDMLKEVDNLIEEERDLTITTLDFNKVQAFKFEKGLEIGIDVVGGLAGIKLGIMIGGTLGGPIGAVVGTLAGASIGIVSSLIGRKGKKAITANRARDTKKQIEPLVENIGETIKREILDGFKDMSNKINYILEQYIITRKEELKEIKARNIEKAENDYKSKFELESLNYDYNYLLDKEKLING